MTVQYLIDSENVGDFWIPLLELPDESTELIVFYTKNSPHMSYESLIRLKESDKKVTFIKCYEGTNALDFQLVSELGYRIARNEEGRFVVVTNDTGYDAAVKYWRHRKRSVKRITGKECKNLDRRLREDIFGSDANVRTPRAVRQAPREEEGDGHQVRLTGLNLRDVEAAAVDEEEGALLPEREGFAPEAPAFDAAGAPGFEGQEASGSDEPEEPAFDEPEEPAFDEDRDLSFDGDEDSMNTPGEEAGQAASGPDAAQEAETDGSFYGSFQLEVPDAEDLEEDDFEAEDFEPVDLEPEEFPAVDSVTEASAAVSPADGDPEAAQPDAGDPPEAEGHLSETLHAQASLAKETDAAGSPGEIPEMKAPATEDPFPEASETDGPGAAGPWPEEAGSGAAPLAAATAAQEDRASEAAAAEDFAAEDASNEGLAAEDAAKEGFSAEEASKEDFAAEDAAGETSGQAVNDDEAFESGSAAGGAFAPEDAGPMSAADNGVAQAAAPDAGEPSGEGALSEAEEPGARETDAAAGPSGPEPALELPAGMEVQGQMELALVPDGEVLPFFPDELEEPGETPEGGRRSKSRRSRSRRGRTGARRQDAQESAQPAEEKAGTANESRPAEGAAKGRRRASEEKGSGKAAEEKKAQKAAGSQKSGRAKDPAAPKAEPGSAADAPRDGGRTDAPAAAPAVPTEEEVARIAACIGADNLAELHNQLATFYGDRGKDIYLSIKNGSRSLPDLHPDLKQKFTYYCEIIFDHGEEPEEVPADLADYLISIREKLGNLNSLRYALIKHYGKEKGRRFYFLLKPYAKAMHQM